MLCQEAITLKSGVGVKICPNTVRIPCLIFANDCLLFCKANSESCSKLKSLLDFFCVTSGQLVIYHKSMLTLSRYDTITQWQLVTTYVIFRIDSPWENIWDLLLFRVFPLAQPFKKQSSCKVRRMESKLLTFSRYNCSDSVASKSTPSAHYAIF